MTNQSVNSNDICRMIVNIGATSSKNEKVELVKQYGEHELFRKVLVYALDPLKPFSIRPQHPTTMLNETAGGVVFDEHTWGLLDDLAARNITGNAASDAVAAEFIRLNAESADLLWRIINKDLRAGCSDSTVNKAIAGLIPEFPYMRCCLPKDTNLSAFSWKDGVFSQEKADGMFVNVDFYNDDTVRISSRNGSDFPVAEFASLADEVRQYLAVGHQNHGEMLVRKAGHILDREVGNGILNSVLQGGKFEADEAPIFVVWDQIPLSCATPKGKYNVSYRDRFASLSEQVTPLLLSSASHHLSLVDTRIVHSMAEAYKHYGEMLAAGKEGTIIKDGAAIWRDGTSKQQVKLKIVAECDLKIVGFTEGNGKNKATFGSITCQTEDGLLEVNVSGFKDKPAKGILTRSQIHEIRDELIGTIMAVSFNDIMYAIKEGDKHSLFLPRHLELRRDKTKADSFARVAEQLEAAKEAYING